MAIEVNNREDLKKMLLDPISNIVSVVPLIKKEGGEVTGVAKGGGVEVEIK